MLLTPPSKILVVRLSSLGDVVLTTPILQSLKVIWPSCHVSVLVKAKYADVFLNHPAVDEVLKFDSRSLWGWISEFRRRSFDLYIDLHDTPRSRVIGIFGGHARRVRYDKRTWVRRLLVWFKRTSPRLTNTVVDRYFECLESLGVPRSPVPPALSLSASEKLSSGWESRLGPGRFIGIAPGAAHSTKRWPAERFSEAAARLKSEWEKASPDSGPVNILLFGSTGDEGAAEKVFEHLNGSAMNAVGKTSLRELMLLIRRCELVLTNDSGIMHVSCALNVPTVAIFGPTVEAFGFFPDRAVAEVVESPGVSCRPCSLHGSDHCRQEHFRCMQDITVDAVTAAAHRVMAMK